MRWMINYKNGKSPCRVNQASAVIGVCIYSFGGYCQQISFKELKNKSPIDVHVLNTTTFKWHKRPVPNVDDPQHEKTPYFRYGHTCVSHSGFIYLWGGRTDWTNNLCNILYQYNPSYHTWAIVNDGGEKPDGRDGHSASVIRDSMYIFGGFVQRFKRFSNDIYEFNFLTSTWTLIVPKNNIRPFWRDFHTATVVGECIYIFGGRMDHGRTRFTGENFYSNDLYSFDVLSLKWTELRTDTSSQSNLLQIMANTVDIQHKFSPCGRRSHSAIAYNNKVIVFGGFQENIQKHFNDMYEYDIEKNQWRMIEQQGKVPCPRRRHACNLVNNKMLIFGGTGPLEIEARVNNDLESNLGMQYDQLLLRLQHNFNYLQNASRERNLFDLDGLNNSLRIARARILQPIQQLLNEHEQERLLEQNNNVRLAEPEPDNDEEIRENVYDDIMERENVEDEVLMGAVGNIADDLNHLAVIFDQNNELAIIDDENVEFDDSDSDDLINNESEDDDNDINGGLLSLSDLHVFELEVPSLKILAELSILDNKIDHSGLPKDLIKFERILIIIGKVLYEASRNLYQ